VVKRWVTRRDKVRQRFNFKDHGSNSLVVPPAVSPRMQEDSARVGDEIGYSSEVQARVSQAAADAVRRIFEFSRSPRVRRHHERVLVLRLAEIVGADSVTHARVRSAVFRSERAEGLNMETASQFELTSIATKLMFPEAVSLSFRRIPGQDIPMVVRIHAAGQDLYVESGTVDSAPDSRVRVLESFLSGVHYSMVYSRFLPEADRSFLYPVSL
jgi:hypothetical protein